MKKFDICLMNPPYDGSLHLKFLEKTIKLSDTVVNISPAVWLEDYAVISGWKTSPKKKYINNLGPHLIDYELIDKKTFQELFNINSWGTGLIGVYKKEENSNIYKEISIKNHLEESLINKIAKPLYLKEKGMQNVTSMYGINKDNTNYKYFLKLPRIHGNINKKDYYDLIANNINLYINKKDKEGKEIYFKTENELINFFNSLNTVFAKFLKYLGCYNSHDINACMPWMEDYTKPWTDERFKKYFDITDEEFNYMKDTLNNYYNSIDKL